MLRKYPQLFRYVNGILLYLSRYYTSIGNSRFTVLSEWLSDCDIIILARTNGLPNSLEYDYHTGLINYKRISKKN